MPPENVVADAQVDSYLRVDARRSPIQPASGEEGRWAEWRLLLVSTIEVSM
jgi:hypothetical protein